MNLLKVFMKEYLASGRLETIFRKRISILMLLFALLIQTGVGLYGTLSSPMGHWTIQDGKGLYFWYHDDPSMWYISSVRNRLLDKEYDYLFHGVPVQEAVHQSVRLAYIVSGSQETPVDYFDKHLPQIYIYGRFLAIVFSLLTVYFTYALVNLFDSSRIWSGLSAMTLSTSFSFLFYSGYLSSEPFQAGLLIMAMYFIAHFLSRCRFPSTAFLCLVIPAVLIALSIVTKINSILLLPACILLFVLWPFHQQISQRNRILARGIPILSFILMTGILIYYFGETLFGWAKLQQQLMAFQTDYRFGFVFKGFTSLFVPQDGMGRFDLFIQPIKWFLVIYQRIPHLYMLYIYIGVFASIFTLWKEKDPAIKAMLIVALFGSSCLFIGILSLPSWKYMVPSMPLLCILFSYVLVRLFRYLLSLSRFTFGIALSLAIFILAINILTAGKVLALHYHSAREYQKYKPYELLRLLPQGSKLMVMGKQFEIPSPVLIKMNLYKHQVNLGYIDIFPRFIVLGDANPRDVAIGGILSDTKFNQEYILSEFGENYRLREERVYKISGIKYFYYRLGGN